MDEAASMTSGGVSLPETLIERQSMAAESGVLVAVAAGAFLLNEDMTPWTGEKPKPGDRVYVEKYAGKLVKGRDGKTYRLMDYGCIGATYEPEEGAESGEPYKGDSISISGGSGNGATASVDVKDGAVTGVKVGG